ncbi:MAG: hypothetical protein HY812_14300 [Planctomycetes bacterium]|nr:hypothetical protein [Planctomycetota bacterium]
MLFALLAADGCGTPPAEAFVNLRAAAQDLRDPGKDGPATDPVEDWLSNMAVLGREPPASGAQREEFCAILCLAARQHPVAAVRAGALRGLGALCQDAPPDGETRGALLAGLADPSPAARVAAAETALPALGFQARPSYAPLLALESTTAEKLAALRVLSDYAVGLHLEGDLLPAVVSCVADRDPGVSFHACRVLARAEGRDDASPGTPNEWLAWWRARSPGRAPAGGLNAREGS